MMAALEARRPRVRACMPHPVDLRRARAWSSIVLAVTSACVGMSTALLRFGPASAQEQPPAPATSPVAASLANGTQPMAFSHRIHAGEHEMSCLYCHAYARRGPVAGVPSVQRCAQCHTTIAADRPEVQKLLAAWEAREALPWIRVHDLPDYVRFTHKRHVRAGVACETCHGDVARMELAEQVAPLTMGWCLNCHEERQAPRDCLTCHY